MSDIDKRLDEILVPPAYGFSAEISCPECMFDFKEAKQAIKQLMVNEFEKMIGEDFRHSNGKYMKNPSYECDECGEPDPEYTINVVLRELRQKLNQLFDKEK